jgi:hypothetical protein
VRAHYLARGLADHGVEVVHAYPAALGHAVGEDPLPAPGVVSAAFRDRDDLHCLLDRCSPALVLVGFWELLAELPATIDAPVVLDLVAPRMVECLFQRDRDAIREALRFLRECRRADRFLCGGERQKHLLAAFLLVAGFECAPESPIDVVPISARPLSARAGARRGAWRFVGGGVPWPWRRPEAYHRALLDACSGSRLDATLTVLSGPYVYGGPGAPAAEPAPPTEDPRMRRSPLLPYAEMERFLREECDIGLELSERNLEREYSASFRSIEWLRCGVPVICNDYLELAGHVREWDAGWVVSAPSDLGSVVRELKRKPAVLRRKRAGARRLMAERFHYRRAIVPLVRYLHAPSRPRRGASLLDP